jgi:hypothetical protein
MSVIEMVQIPIPQAVQLTGLDEAIVRHLVGSGVVAGSQDLCDLDQIEAVAERLLSAREQRAGYGILGPDAASKYNFQVMNLYRWQREGWIKVLIDRQRNRLFDEGDIAFARALADEVQQVQGKAIFPAKPRSGRPRKNLN